MNIGQAASASGVSAKMIRYYETIGLIRAAGRTGSNYRTFAAQDVAELRFIRRARSLGFPLDEIVRLLSLWRDASRPSHEVKAIAEKHVADLEARIGDIQALADSLRALAQSCVVKDESGGPNLEDLGAPPVA